MNSSQWAGRVIEHTYTPGWIILAYCISLIGCWTTLELLHKRTSNHGYYNWYAHDTLGVLNIMLSQGQVSFTRCGGRDGRSRYLVYASNRQPCD